VGVSSLDENRMVLFIVFNHKGFAGGRAGLSLSLAVQELFRNG
jgi:hypothetical protein